MLFTNNRYGKFFAKDPAVVFYKDKYFLYHSVFDNDNVLHIDIAVSDDGENWTLKEQLPLTQDCEKNGIGAPGAIVLDEVVHLFYQTYGNGVKDSICHATSTDGINFVKDEGNPVYSPTTDWCCGRAIDADVCVLGDRLLLYIATRDHAFEVQMLGVAAAPLSSSFTKGDFVQLYAGAVLHPELPWEGKCIEAPATIVIDGKVYMFYGGAYNCCPQQIGCAVSEDGISFKRLSKTPILPNGKEGDWNSCESGHPYVFEDKDGRIYIYYQGSPDMGKSWYISRVEVSIKGDLVEIIT